MSNKIFQLVLLNILVGSFISGVSLKCYANDSEISGLDMLDIFGDFRFRFEQDWDSKDTSGVKRDDRARARIRTRIGIKITPNDFFEFSARLRSGDKNSQQSPHITVEDFSGNDNGERGAVIDKWYMKLKNDHLWVWGGRNGIPFWKQKTQDNLFQDH